MPAGYSKEGYFQKASLNSLNHFGFRNATFQNCKVSPVIHQLHNLNIGLQLPRIFQYQNIKLHILLKKVRFTSTNAKKTLGPQYVGADASGCLH